MLLGQRLALLGGAGDRSGSAVFTGAGGTTTAVAAGFRRARAAGVVARLLDAQLVADVFGDRRRRSGRSRRRSRSSSSPRRCSAATGRCSPSGEFVQTPCSSVSVWPCWAVPVMVGQRGVFRHRGHDHGASAADSLAALEPPALLARLLHAQLVADVFGDRRVGLGCRAGDRGAARCPRRCSAATGRCSPSGSSSRTRAPRSASGLAGRCR